ncbi:MAG: winged helix DNA-binding domain-containing protein [Anaerolineae bacterium]|nr:winged helix DNA-binding domain-containing protein [Anaerolineae bacterium]
MSDPIIIDKPHARRFLLAHLHLLPPRKLHGKQGVLDYVRHVNCIQYDPINVVGQNPHLVLQSRVRGYKPSMLDALLYEDRRLIDGFDKQMSIYPVEDWPSFTYYRQQMATNYMEDEQTAAAAKLVDRVRKEIEARGPLSSLDLEDDTRMDWWLAGSVRAVRIAMDILFYGGETVVHHRVGTRRYFELSKRVLPPKLYKASNSHSSQDDYLEWHVFRRAGGLGLVYARPTAAFGGTIGWRGGGIRAAIARLAEKGQLVRVSIKDLERQKFYVRRDDLPALEAAAKAPRSRQGAALIAPLDNLMWDRNLIEMLFDFYYSWEVYLPAAKRQYGYYVLPVLYGDRLVARMDPEFDRAGKVFTIKNWWWEDGGNVKDESMLSALEECLSAFGHYLEAVEIRLGGEVRGQPGLKKAVKEANRALTH